MTTHERYALAAECEGLANKLTHEVEKLLADYKARCGGHLCDIPTKVWNGLMQHKSVAAALRGIAALHAENREMQEV